jgi:hypothetical protein
LNVTNLRTHQLSDSYGTESSAPRIEVPLSAICPIFFVIVSIAGPTECRVTVNIELIKLNIFAMAPYGVVLQLLALVQ